MRALRSILRRGRAANQWILRFAVTTVIVAAATDVILVAADAASTKRRHYAIRAMYHIAPVRSSGHVRTAGTNAVGINADERPLLRAVAAQGLTAIVQPGYWSNAHCSFTWTDAHVVRSVSKIARNSATKMFYVADEPDARSCPNAPQAIAARTRLLHKVAPGIPTILANYRQLSAFRNSADRIALVMYPCSIQWYGGCAYHYITDIAAEADSLGIRYFGVIQAFGDPWGFTLPTRRQLRRIFRTWRATNMEGYFVFAWDWPQGRPEFWLRRHPALLRELAAQAR